jgi:SagB-type dehydrogenase family enzyme
MTTNGNQAAIARDRRLLRKLAQGSAQWGRETKSALFEVFHENTKLGRLTARAYTSWILNFNQKSAEQQATSALANQWQTGNGGKPYTLMERCALPPVEARSDLERTIAARRSVRAFSGESMSLDELARLLFFSYGRTDRGGPFRAVASGGALYPLELYVVALKIDGLQPGLYHYAIDSNHLDIVRLCDPLAALKDVVYLHGIDIDQASAVIVATAAFKRTTIKYLDRGYRMILMEVGEAAQNLCLLATSLNLGACLVGGFNDDALSEFLEVDGVGEAPLLPVIVGRAVGDAGR